MIKTGCVGFPIGKKAYQSKLNVVEIPPWKEKPPRAQTLEAWRSNAPSQFEFVVSVPPFVLFPQSQNKSYHAPAGPKGRARDSISKRTAEEGLKKCLDAAQRLSSRILLFRIPSSIQANPDRIGRLHHVFKTLPRESRLFVWEPPFHWPEALVLRLSKTFQLHPAFNPLLRSLPVEGPIRYFRLQFPRKGEGAPLITDEDFRRVRRACAGKLNYVLFDKTPTSYKDALRFASL